MELQVNHVYLVKNLPIKRSTGLFYSEQIDKDKQIEKIIVKEITNSCYLLTFTKEGSILFYIEKSNPNIVYLEDLGLIAK